MFYFHPVGDDPIWLTFVQMGWNIPQTRNIQKCTLLLIHTSTHTCNTKNSTLQIHTSRFMDSRMSLESKHIYTCACIFIGDAMPSIYDTWLRMQSSHIDCSPLSSLLNYTSFVLLLLVNSYHDVSYIYPPFPKNGLQVFAEKNRSWLLVVALRKPWGNPWKGLVTIQPPGFPLLGPKKSATPTIQMPGPGHLPGISSRRGNFSQGIGLLFNRRSHHQKYARKGTRSKGRNGKRNVPPRVFSVTKNMLQKNGEDLGDTISQQNVVKVYVGCVF